MEVRDGQKDGDDKEKDVEGCWRRRWCGHRKQSGRRLNVDEEGTAGVRGKTEMAVNASLACSCFLSLST